MESGASSIELLRPYNEHENALKRISSSHSARSGQLQLRYPDEWQGSIFGEARSGSLSLRGRDVRMIDQSTGAGKKYVHAQKGHGESTLKFDIESGGVDAIIGY
jgi:uncharacterized protein involved in type VI secretion and phage assembly